MATTPPFVTTPQPPPHTALVVRSLPAVTPEERERILDEVEYNVFAFPAGLLTCDFLSDSGTSAMTDVQWASLMRGDESYGRNWGYYCLLDAFRDIFERGSRHQQHALHEILTGGRNGSGSISGGVVDMYRSKLLGSSSQGGFVNGGPHQLSRPNFFILPQGRCAETLLFSTMSAMIAEAAPTSEKKPIIISNGFFDTTGANAAVAGFQLQTFTQPGLTDPFPGHLIGKQNNFKGNLDLEQTKTFLAESAEQVKMILVTITNNWAAAQPVSMANIRGAAALAKEADVPLFFDACRFAENAYFIQRYEEGYADTDIIDIVQEMFSYVDGFTISLKKDGLANMGGVLSFRDNGVFARKYEGIGMLLKERQILCYGNDSYGGMSGRDLMAATAGLYKVVDQTYLAGRINQVQQFAEKLQANGVACLSPPGGHAVYLDMDSFFFGCNRNPEDFASVGFTLQLIKDYGIRAAEAGPFGWAYDLKSPDDPERAKIPNLVRFAVPRHVYSDEHINYTVASIKALYDRRHTIPNAVITRGKTMKLRHFSAGLKLVPPPVSIQSSNATWFGEASKQLHHLFKAVSLTNDKGKEELLRALALATGEWGQTAVPSPSSNTSPIWTSSVSNDGSPIEYSVAIDQATGEAELRFLTEAQPPASLTTPHNLWEQLTAAATLLNNSILASYPTSTSLKRFNSIRDLLMPPTTTTKTKMAAWHSFAYSVRKARPQWKIYLDPCNASGDDATACTREAFSRLGLASAWRRVEGVLGPLDSVIYFSLDLTHGGDDEDEGARVKVYIAHRGGGSSTMRELSAEIARKHEDICRGSAGGSGSAVDSYEIQRFIASLSGADFDAEGLVGSKKPLLSCFAFTAAPAPKVNGHNHSAETESTETNSTEKDSESILVSTTVHFPIDAYTPDDKEAKRRVEGYFASCPSSVPGDGDGVESVTAAERYNRVLGAVQRRPLDAGRGIHAWVSLKQNVGLGGDKKGKGRGFETTFYLCPEIVGPGVRGG